MVLSDTKFIDAAGELINRRLREYNQSLNPTPDPSTPSTPSVKPDDVDEGPSASVRTYLAFLCRSGGELTGILDALDSQEVCALFLMTPQVLKENGDLIRRILGTGHSVGILANGAGPEETRALLEQGNRVLAQTIHTRTTLAWVPKDQRAIMENEGWVCWSETLSLSPTSNTGANAFASSTLRRLAGRTRPAYLTMPGTADSARVLPALLRQLKSSSFVVSVPMETRL